MPQQEEAVDGRDASWESRLPTWQRKLHINIDGWIFAFIVAMAIRHFFLEAYRIPTASMEPMLYGDQSIMSADHVVVDKTGHVFGGGGAERWDVTVFQFPWPEVGPLADPKRAWNAFGERSDRFPRNPLMHRNFVKRCVARPGDRFFISGGDLFVADPVTGVFAIPPKPPEVQEALWLTIYSQDADPAYLPWQADGSARLAVEDGVMRLDLVADDQHGVRYQNRLVNLYVKPGSVRVRPRPQADDPVRGARLLGKQVEVSLTRPLFDYEGKIESIWDLHDWEISRLTTADLDNRSHGTRLNEKMDDELVDLRIGFAPRALDGELVLRLELGTQRDLRLRLSEAAWTLQVDGAEAASGQGPVLGRRWELVHLDGRVVVRRDGLDLHASLPLAAIDLAKADERSRIRFLGSGHAELKGLRIDRDLYYTRSGFLEDQSQEYKELDELFRFEIRRMRRQILQQLVDPELRAALIGALDAREALRSADSRWLQPVGVDAATALQAPEDGYLLLGDNSPFSWDGRNWGWVPAINLRGEVLVVVWPWGKGRLHVVR